MDTQDDGRGVPPRDTIAAVADAIADGRTPDWSSLESTAGSGRERAVLSDLRVIAAVAQAHAAEFDERRDAHPAAADGSPHQWGNFVIREKIGHGRFGDVYRAWDPHLDRDVALKLLQRRERASADDEAIIEEGRLMARVRHPSVVTIHGARRIDGRTGLWMDLVDGMTLEQELAERGAFPAAEVVSTGVTLCEAVSAVHRAGLLHRDIKTSNVLRDPQRGVLLGDFGTGLEIADEQAGDSPRDLAGTPLYIAPEVLDGEPATVGSDIYSLGVLLFRLATGSFPVPGRTLQEVRLAHRRGHRTPVRDLAAGVPPALAGVIERALAPRAADRFEDADAMLGALEACRAARPVTSSWRRPVAIVAAGVAALATLWFALSSRQPSATFNERDWLLVAAFRNRTADPLLSDTLDALLGRELRSSSFVNVVPRERVNDTLMLMRRETDTRLDESVAREVALRDGGIRLLVAGDVTPAEPGYVLTVDLVDPTSSTTMAIITDRAATVDELPDAVRRIAIRLRERLNETATSIQNSRMALQRVTTPSLVALQQYSQAALLWDQLDSLVATAQPLAAMDNLLGGALAVDPAFASAHILLAMTLERSSPRAPRWDEILSHADRALALSGSVPGGERLFIAATNYRLHALASDEPVARQALYQQAIDTYEELLTSEPDYAWAYAGLDRVYFETNRPADRIRNFLRLGEIRPNGVVWRAEAAHLAFSSGDLDGAKTLAGAAPRFVPQRELERNPVRVSWLKLFPAQLAWLEDDPARALRATDEVAADLPGSPAEARWQFGSQVLYMYLTLGRLRQAEETIQWLPETPYPARFQSRAVIADEWGDRAKLHDLIAQARDEDRKTVPSFLLASGFVDDWRRWRSSVPRPIPLQDALFALSEGRLDDAIATLGDIPDTEPNYMTYIQARRALAGAWWSKGDPDRAVAVLERTSAEPRWRSSTNWSLGFVWMKMRADLAELYRHAGRTDDAHAVEAHLRQLLAVADEDHPIKVRLDALSDGLR
jgi:serine/threonine protein kinase